MIYHRPNAVPESLRAGHLLRNPAFVAGLVILLLCGCAGIHRVSGPTYTIENHFPNGSYTKQIWSWLDNGHGYEFFERGTLTNFSVVNSNLMGWPGVSTFGVGQVTVDISSNAAAVVTATGTAVGSAIGTAAKTFVKP